MEKIPRREFIKGLFGAGAAAAGLGAAKSAEAALPTRDVSTQMPEGAPRVVSRFEMVVPRDPKVIDTNVDNDPDRNELQAREEIEALQRLLGITPPSTK